MDKKLTIFDYLSKIFAIFGITIVLLNVFCLLFGEDARNYSTIFRLGSDGLSIETMMQFFLIISVIITFRFIFMTDFLIKKMPLSMRIILLFVTSFASVIIFILICGWFPANEPKAWIMFLICFAVSCTVSTLISVIKEKQENKKLEEALTRMKTEEQ